MAVAESDRPAALDQPGNRSVPGSRARHAPAGSRAAFLLLAVLGIVLVTATWTRLTGPFGDSHDGRNAAVWATGSRALREEGPVSSHLGATQDDGRTYANHPPLMMWTMAGSEALLGERPVTTRLPILLATLAAIGLLYAVGREAGFEPLASAFGVTAALGSAMALTYGVMPDTPMFSLPFGLAIVWVWQRASVGRAVRPLLVVAAGVAASASGWEAGALAVVAGSSLVASGWMHHDRPRRRSGLLLLGGAAAGIALTFGWATWAYGSTSVLLDQFVRRSSDADGATPTIALSNQLRWLVDLLGPALLGLGLAVVAAVLDRRVRNLFVLVLATTLGYATVFWNGAAIHDYWNYWFVVPISLGLAWGAQRILDVSAGRAPRSVVVAVATVATLAVLTVSVGHQPAAAATIDRGFDPALAVERHGRTGIETTVADIGRSAGFESWLAYDTRLLYRHLVTSEDLRDLASEDPQALVLVHHSCSDGPAGELCRNAWVGVEAQDDSDGVSQWQVVPAGELIEQLPR